MYRVAYLTAGGLSGTPDEAQALELDLKATLLGFYLQFRGNPEYLAKADAFFKDLLDSEQSQYMPLVSYIYGMGFKGVTFYQPAQSRMVTLAKQVWSQGRYEVLPILIKHFYKLASENDNPAAMLQVHRLGRMANRVGCIDSMIALVNVIYNGSAVITGNINASIEQLHKILVLEESSLIHPLIASAYLNLEITTNQTLAKAIYHYELFHRLPAEQEYRVSEIKLYQRQTALNMC